MTGGEASRTHFGLFKAVDDGIFAESGVEGGDWAVEAPRRLSCVEPLGACFGKENKRSGTTALLVFVSGAGADDIPKTGGQCGDTTFGFGVGFPDVLT